MGRFFTSEAVTEGHPDKICDQISDAVLDEVLAHDPNGRVACECFCTTGMVLVGGEITTHHYVDVEDIVRKKVTEIGYTRGKFGFDADNLAVLTTIHAQSPDIAMGVDESEGHEQGAGDQGIMFGYATNETEEFMPITLVLAQKLALRLSYVRKSGILGYLRPDGKSQVTVEYDDNNKVKRIDAIVVSSQHDDDITIEKLREDIKNEVILPVIPSNLLDENTKFFINPTGRFVKGGPAADSGLTGRKLICDTYGGAACHGGGAFSGKDPSKVDRSGAYMARYVAKNLVAAGLCDKCQVQLSYAIGVAHPTSVTVDTFGTNKVSQTLLEKAVNDLFPLTPKGIIDHLDLKRPIYGPTSCYGHFGRDGEGFTWEKTDMVSKLLEYLK